MRTFGGIEITKDFVDDLVEEWHGNKMPTSLRDFIKANTGWSEAEYYLWAVDGKIPE